MSYYDNYANVNTDDCECSPKIIDHGVEYEGGGEYSSWELVNCEKCDCKECEFWAKYN